MLAALLWFVPLVLAGTSTAPSSSPPAATSTRPVAPSTRPVVQPSLPSARPWIDAAIDASAIAADLECFEFAYTRQTVREPDGAAVQRDILVFQARANRNMTLAVLQARMLDETGTEIDRSVVRFKPVVLHWTKGQSATASCWIDPGLMPRVRRIEILPL